MIRSFLFFALMISFGKLFGEIKNGYQDRIHGYKISLENLKRTLSGKQSLSLLQVSRIKSQIRELVCLISYFELTDKLIKQLRVIVPDVYNEMDSLRDKKGRPTDVFIKVIPREHAKIQLVAASFFKQSRADANASISEYGEYSVSIDVWLSEHALFLLCHELGHIKYVVPNLVSYCDYWKKNYRDQISNLSYIGHRRGDQSGEWAIAFERTFLKAQAKYLKQEGQKPESAIAIMRQIRMKNKNLETGLPIQHGDYLARSGSTFDHQLYISKSCSTSNNFEMVLRGYENSPRLQD